MSVLSNHETDAATATPRTAVRAETVGAEHAGRRIDNYLLQLLKPAPKSLVYKLLRSGQVRVNGGRCKPDYRLMTDDVLRIPPVIATVAGEIHITETTMRALGETAQFVDRGEIEIKGLGKMRTYLARAA